jgi:hypothetical protein
LNFSRETLISLAEAVVVVARTHAALDKLLMRFNIENAAPKALGGLEKREAALAKYLLKHGGTKGPRGATLALELLEHVATERNQVGTSFIRVQNRQKLEALDNALSQDGYDIERGEIRRSFPDEIDLPANSDEIHDLLSDFGWNTTLGHLEQARSAHTRGEWASTNANLRAFFESLIDETAAHLWPEEAVQRGTTHGRAELLAQGLQPEEPFFVVDLNEWVVGNRGGFIQGLWKRLHPEGPHPGLSSQEEATFRLHLVLLVARHLLRRLACR